MQAEREAWSAADGVVKNNAVCINLESINPARWVRGADNIRTVAASRLSMYNTGIATERLPYLFCLQTRNLICSRDMDAQKR